MLIFFFTGYESGATCTLEKNAMSAGWRTCRDAYFLVDHTLQLLLWAYSNGACGGAHGHRFPAESVNPSLRLTRMTDDRVPAFLAV
jgi:hypothetical protein